MSAIVSKSQRAHYLTIRTITQQRKSGRYINVCVLHLTPLAGVITISSIAYCYRRNPLIAEAPSPVGEGAFVI